MTSSKGEMPPPCPDPSVHPQYAAGQDSANKAAQLATHSSTSSREIEALGPDGRLSAAGAATSLRYAKPQDLPSFPSVGIDTANSGNKAAGLASSGQKPIELWKPDASASASKAALLASRDGGKLDLWEYKADGTGNSAASIAMGKNSSPQLDYGYTEDGHRKALLAATKSLSSRDKPSLSDSAAQTALYPDQQNAGFNALNAATVANRPTSRTSTDYRFSDPGMEAARVKNMQGVSRDMYGERPQVGIEVEERRRQEALHASAVSMAKQLYDLERDDMQRLSNPSGAAAERVGAQTFHSATTSASGDALRMQAMNYVKIQEAAQKLAAERLAKLDPDGVLAYREHYGYGNQGGGKSRFSMLRGKGSSTTGVANDDDSSDDEVQAAKIKSQMSNLNTQMASVDAAKRAQDRESLMAAAERAVHARMQTMDEKVFADTGKMSPQMAEEWAAKARAKAAADSEQRMVNHGKIHIGGGRYMDQAEIEAIAAGRMQPTLDEINDEAERRRAHEAAVKADLEHRKQQLEEEKQREREIKAEIKKNQDEEKEKARQERAVEKEKLRQEREVEKEKLRQEREAEKEKQNMEKMHRDLERRIAKAEAKQAKEQEKTERAAKESADREAMLQARRERAAEEKQQEEEEAKKAFEEKKQEEERAAITDVPESTAIAAAAPAAPAAEESVAPDVTETAAQADPITEREVVAEAGPSTEADAFADEPSPTAKVEAGSPPPLDTAGATSTTLQEDSTTTPSRRDSRLKGFIGKLTGKRSSKAEPDKVGAEKADDSAPPISPPEATPTSAVAETSELSEKAKGKQRASLDSAGVSNLSDEDGLPKLGSVDTGNDVFEEARDQFESDTGAGRTSTAKESVTSRTESKFQEQL